MSERTAQIALSVDEYHPWVHGYEGGTVVYAPQSQVARWRKVMGEFEEVQAEMLAAFREAEKQARRDAELEAAAETVRRAEARLAELQWEDEHPPHVVESWPVRVEDGRESWLCAGPRYGFQEDAWQGRLRQYDRAAELGVAMPFDLAPYRCDDGHWHLGRTS